jgi:protein involved in polysaccharide export with SLBB domain
VELSGEFVYPGSYVLLEGETLGQLIERAGGFTENAYLTAGMLTRPSVKRLEQERIDEYAKQLEREIMQTTAVLAAEQGGPEIQQILEQQKNLLKDLRATEPIGRVVIDLTKSKSYRDFLMEDGDALFIPKTKYTVSVIGEVYNPATFRHDPDDPRVRSYVERSGGYKRTAEEKDLYVIRANGSILTRRMTNVRRARLRPGDVVVVPQKLETGRRYRRFTHTLQTIKDVLTIASLSTTTLLGAQALKP